MPPKKTPPSPARLDTSVHSDLANQIEELTKLVTSYTARFDKLEGLLSEVSKENKCLKESLVDRDKEILRLSKKLNAQEQYNRSWSIRIMNLEIPESEASDPERVMKHVYDSVLLPIFRGAFDKKLIQEIPPVSQILETAHILPSKSGSINPVIARFYTRNIRAMMFRLRKEHALRLPADNSAGRSRGAQSSTLPGKFKFPFYEDLTKINFAKMRALAQHEKVHSCWSVSGILRYRLHGENTVRKVNDVFDTVSDILSSASAKPSS